MKILKRALAVCALSIGVMAASAVHTAAYIDPSIVTYLISIISGVVVAGGAGVAIYWKRIKQFFKKRKAKKNAPQQAISAAKPAPVPPAAPPQQEQEEPANG